MEGVKILKFGLHDLTRRISFYTITRLTFEKT